MYIRGSCTASIGGAWEDLYDRKEFFRLLERMPIEELEALSREP